MHGTPTPPERAILIHRPVLTFDGDGARQGDEEDAAFHGKLPPGILPHGLPTVKEVQPAVTAAPQEKKEEEKEKKGQLRLFDTFTAFKCIFKGKNRQTQGSG